MNIRALLQVDKCNKNNNEKKPDDIKVKTRKKQQNKKTFMGYITNFMKDDIISLNEFSLLVDYVKKGGNIVELKKFHKILLKIVDNGSEYNIDEFIRVCSEIFFDIYKRLDNPFENTKNIRKSIKGIDYKLLGKSLIDNHEIKFTKDQKRAIYKLTFFLTSTKVYTYGLYGYAGTGKTTTIIEFITYLLKNKFIGSVCLTAPTNKAVNVMKSKFRNGLKDLIKEYSNKSSKGLFSSQLEELNDNGLKVDFLTIHKLLNYKNEYDGEGDRIFVKGNKSNIMRYDLVIIDECSMISMKIINDIFEDIRKRVKEQGLNNEYKNIPKVLFVGDPAQLPPVNEKNSIIFSKNEDDFDLDNFIKNVEDRYDSSFSKRKMNGIKKRMNELKNNILNQQSTILKKVMRTKNDNVINLCNNIRNWVTNVISHPEVFRYKGKGVYLYKYDRKGKKNTEWLNEYMKRCKKQEDTGCTNIILTWTNRQTDQYNNVIRKRLLNKTVLNRFEVGDYLIFKDFYNFDECAVKGKGNDEKKRFYTSEQIKITDIDIIKKACQTFNISYPKKARKIQYSRHIENEYTNLINTINKQTKRIYKAYKIQIHRVADICVNTIPDTYTLYVIHENSKVVLEEEKEFVVHKIREFRMSCLKKYREQINQIDRLIIGKLWKEYNKVFVDVFAEVDYSHSISTHRSQGSNFGNVFVDVDDILKNKNTEETKRCIYTAFTRTAEELHLLI